MNHEKMLKITCPDKKQIEVSDGISLRELSLEYENFYNTKIVAAKVNNDIKELSYKLNEDAIVEFITLKHYDGARIYTRSMCFLLILAVKELYPDKEVLISHSISKGVYCELKGYILSEAEVEALENKMREIVSQKAPFIKKLMTLDDAKNLFKQTGRSDMAECFENRKKPYVTLYSCKGVEDYFYGYMVPHTGYLDVFRLKHYTPGLIILLPEKTNPSVVPEFVEQKKLFNIFVEYKKWGEILKVRNIGDLNKIIKNNEIDDLIRVAEALHEKKIAQIADMISNSEHKKKIVLISGPSSSGKTTFAKRLSIQLRVNGLKPHIISLDDYFLDREHSPRDENGNYDFEALEAIDIPLFNAHMHSMLRNEEIEIPIFNFTKGAREKKGRPLKITDEHVLIIEGIHGLNNKLTESISNKSKFKIYVSALTSMNIDEHNLIPSTDTRFIRRIVRDHQFRGSNALNTIKMWPSVRRGEIQNIFPFQEEADVMFNSSLIYELSALKSFAEPLLAQVDRNNAEYSEAKRLLEFLNYFSSIKCKEIPANSIIREFIGKSCFY